MQKWSPDPIVSILLIFKNPCFLPPLDGWLRSCYWVAAAGCPLRPRWKGIRPGLPQQQGLHWLCENFLAVSVDGCKPALLSPWREVLWLRWLIEALANFRSSWFCNCITLVLIWGGCLVVNHLYSTHQCRETTSIVIKSDLQIFFPLKSLLPVFTFS